MVSARVLQKELHFEKEPERSNLPDAVVKRRVLADTLILPGSGYCSGA